MNEMTFAVEITVLMDSEPEDDIYHWLCNQIYEIRDIINVKEVDP